MQFKRVIRAVALCVTALPVIGFAQPGLYLKTAVARGSKEPAAASTEMKRRNAGRWHYTLVFRKIPGQAEIQALQAKGATVVQFLPERGLTASVPDGTLLDGLDIEWAGRLTAMQKVSPRLVDAGLLSAIPGDTGTHTVLVEFHSDVARADAEAIVLEEGASIQQNPDLLSWQMMVRGRAADISRLADWDEVSYLFPVSRELAEGRPAEACAGAIIAGGRVGQLIAKVGEGWDGAGKGSADLTYSFSALTRKLSPEQAKAEIVRAMNEWSKQVKIRFTEGGSAQSARNINVMFGTGDHSDGYPFDGPGKALAHTFFPAPPNPEPIAGDLHIDDDENWQVGANIDLFSVVLHEMGHALGLAHSDNPAAVMYPYYKRVSGLGSEDISTIRELYAPQDGTTPAPAPAALELSVTQPVGGTLDTQADQVSLAGTTAGGTGTIQVAWSSNRGPSGVATGFRPWSIASIALTTGENLITITATDGAQNRATQIVRIVKQTAPTAPSPNAPTIRITAPSPTGTFQTTSQAVTITGIAGPAGSVSRIVWVSSRGTGGAIVGGVSWTIGPVSLEAGLNEIKVTAVGSQGTTAEAVLTVQYTPVGPSGVPTDPDDRVAPSLVITSPAVNTFSTPSPAVTITGTASDNVAVTEVNWVSSNGRSGAATGTTSWRIVDLALNPGINVFMIRAFDAAGNMSWRSLVITRQ